jgi:ABC-type antimicrobial peptide transport system permease subunit
MRLVGAGLLVGLAAAWAATRLISGILFGLTAMDPLSLAAAVSVMAAVALVAGYVPAHRAAEVAPISALRHE